MMFKDGLKRDNGADDIPADEYMFVDSLEGIELPEPTFINLIMNLSGNALIHLGIVKAPDYEQEVNPEMAKHLIDTIVMLQEKTRGNLNETELKHINEIIYQLKISYVNIINQQ
ncbi:MAG: DUF1844 domain-containing protein [Nitrospirae bacterium YQR-1]